MSAQPLPKHLRPRWRYLAIEMETWPDADVDRRAFQRELWAAARSLLGDPTTALADLRILRFRWTDGVGEAIVRVRRDGLEDGRAAVACVDAVGDEPIRIRVVGVGGTIRACEEKYLGGHRQESAERTVAFDGERRGAVVRNGTVDVRIDDSWIGATDLDLP